MSPSKAEPPELPSQRRRVAVGGPASKLTPAVVRSVAEGLAKGYTRTDAAALVGVPGPTLKKWIDRGRLALEAGDEADPHAALFVAVERAEAKYRCFLVDCGNDAVADRNMNDKFIRWRLSLSAPKDFAHGMESANQTPFDSLSPAECLDALKAKLQRFLDVQAEEAKAAPKIPDPSGGAANGG